jgi:hypothetical protein
MNRNTSKPCKEKTKQQETIKKPEGVEITEEEFFKTVSEILKESSILGQKILDLFNETNVSRAIALNALANVFVCIADVPDKPENLEDGLKIFVDLVRLRLEEDAV